MMMMMKMCLVVVYRIYLWHHRVYHLQYNRRALVTIQYVVANT